MTAVFLDSNIPIYAIGRQHPLREPCRRIITAIATGELEAWTNMQVMQELLHRCQLAHRRGSPMALESFDAFAELLPSTVLAVESGDLSHARALAVEHPDLPAADLVHLATMERAELSTIITADRHFDEIAGIERIDPASFAAAG